MGKMTTQWNTRGLGRPDSPPPYDESLGEDGLVLLMQGKNSFGDRIFSYLKLTTNDLRRMQSAIQSGTPFNPSDFGTVVAAGKGEPTPEIRAEVESMYKVLSSGRTQPQTPVAAAPAPKSWDEF
jgi:hypothetical protein